MGGGCGVILIAVLLGIALWRHRQHSSKQSASSSQRRSVSAGSVTSGSVPKARTWHLTDSGVTMPTRQPVYPPLPKPASAGNSGDDDPASVSSDEEDEVDVTRKTVTTSRRSAEQLRQPSDDSASNSDDSSIVEAVPTSRTANDVNPSSGNANQSSPELKQERNTPSPTKVPSRSPAISPPVAPTVTTVSGSDNDNDEDDTQLIHSIAASLRSTTPKQRRQSAATTRSSRSKSRQSRSGNGKKKSGRRSVSRAASVVSVGEEGSSNAELLEELRRARLLAETQDELWRQERKHMLKLMRKLAKRSNTVITEELKLQSILGGALAVNTAALSDSELESIQAPVAMSSNSIGIAMPSPTRALSSPKPPLHPQSPTRSAIVSGRGTPRSSGGDSRKGMVSFVSGGSESTGEVLGTLQFTQETPQLRLVQHSNGSVKVRLHQVSMAAYMNVCACVRVCMDMCACVYVGARVCAYVMVCAGVSRC